MEKLIKKYTKNGKATNGNNKKKRDSMDEYYLWWSHIRGGHD